MTEKVPDMALAMNIAVVEVDDGVEEAAGGGEQHGVGKRGGLGKGVLGLHDEVDWWTSQRVS
jgi:hypothetical protein